jgi:hypothetical protein
MIYSLTFGLKIKYVILKLPEIKCVKGPKGRSLDFSIFQRIGLYYFQI